MSISGHCTGGAQEVALRGQMLTQPQALGSFYRIWFCFSVPKDTEILRGLLNRKWERYEDELMQNEKEMAVKRVK